MRSKLRGMPEIHTTGVPVDEAPGPKPIQPVGTSTAAFVGPAVQGPVGGVSKRLSSFAEFEAVYGIVPNLQFSSSGGTLVTVPNYLAMAGQEFFGNGGQQIYVSRVAGGSGNVVPGVVEYRAALATLEGVKDISIVAAPGSSVFEPAHRSANGAPAIVGELIAHAEKMRYRIAVLDSPPGYSSSDVQALRASINSSYAALYYPWVTVTHPSPVRGAAKEMHVPSSGFVCGIYARTDMQQGVFKAPANQQMVGAVGLERVIQDSENDVLNAAGINCLRSFAGRGILVWGARTISSDPDYKYVNVRRYMAYLEESISQGTQWAVFEQNGPPLWAEIRNTITNFLMTEWRKGGMQGATASEAFFVKCDATTMTQNDLDNGRVICLVGVAAVRPADFVILRIGWQIGTRT